jgi:hypothetical protein
MSEGFGKSDAPEQRHNRSIFRHGSSDLGAHGRSTGKLVQHCKVKTLQFPRPVFCHGHPRLSATPRETWMAQRQ